ncbi:MAG TPA: class I SAM-dependent methyltransferase, partial [Acidimicrobiales bacterium]|nr:class I SAM-dependent methyltransferase [Acidimicrobiales bacterium]
MPPLTRSPDWRDVTWSITEEKPTSTAEGIAPGGPNRFARGLFSGLPIRYDRLVEWLTMWQNRRWRREMIGTVTTGDTALAEAGAGRPRLLLDVASGTAGVALQLAGRSGARVVGLDLSPEMLARGAANVAAAADVAASPNTERGVVTLTMARAEQLPFPDATFDGLTFTYLLRYVGDVAATLSELARVLAPGAPIASLDFAVPERAVVRGAWWAYTRLLLPVAGLLTGGPAWWRVGRFLGRNISSFYDRHPLASIVADWQRAGLVDVRLRTMTLGGAIVMSGRRASS